MLNNAKKIYESNEIPQLTVDLLANYISFFPALLQTAQSTHQKVVIYDLITVMVRLDQPVILEALAAQQFLWSIFTQEFEQCKSNSIVLQTLSRLCTAIVNQT